MVPSLTPSLTVSTSETNLTTAAIASVDGIVALDFKNELPIVITKTIAATVTKAVAAYAINEGARQGGGDIAGLVAQIATAGYQMAVNIADTRTWTTLPKEFQLARVPTPADHKIHLSAAGQQADATVEDGAVNLVYVKSINPGCPLIVTTMKLNGAPLHPIAVIHPPASAPALAAEPAPVASPAPVAAPAITATAADTNSPPAPAPAANTSTSPAPPPTATESREKPAAPTPPAEPAPVAPPPAPTPPAPEKSGGVQTIANPAVQRLCESLKSENPETVINSLKLLRQLNDSSAVPQILPCLNHPNFKVIREACRTLAVLGDRNTIPSLQMLLARNDVRNDARAAIIRIANTHRM